MNIFKKLEKLENLASDFGFAWPHAGMILDQIASEVGEVKAAIELRESMARIQSEIGDLLHATLSLCVFLGIDQELTLTQSIEKFEKRFLKVQEIAQENGYETLQGESIQFLMKFWDQAKEMESQNDAKI